MKKILLTTFLVFIFVLSSKFVHAQWESCDNGLWARTIYAIAISENNIFAGNWGAGIFHSTDSGDSWTQEDMGASGILAFTITISGNNIFAGTNQGIFLSTNNGDSWTEKSEFSVHSFGISGNNIFAAAGSKGIFLSTNNGNSWEERNTGFFVTYTKIYFLAISGDKIYAGSNEGVYISTNNGYSWEITGLTDDTAVYSIIISGNNIFAGTDRGVFLSPDNGNSWAEKNTGLTDNIIRSIAINGNNIYSGTDRGGIFRAKLSDFGITDVEKQKFSSKKLSIYPNPFFETTTLKFNLETNSNVEFSIFNSLGQEVSVLIDELMYTGNHEITFGGSNLPSGTYYYVFKAGNRIETGKLLLIK